MDDDIFRTGLISQARIEKPMLPDSLWIDLVMIEGGRGGETILWILGYGLLLFRSIVRPTLGEWKKERTMKKRNDINFIFWPMFLYCRK